MRFFVSFYFDQLMLIVNNPDTLPLRMIKLTFWSFYFLLFLVVFNTATVLCFSTSPWFSFLLSNTGMHSINGNQDQFLAPLDFLVNQPVSMPNLCSILDHLCPDGIEDCFIEEFGTILRNCYFKATASLDVDEGFSTTDKLINYEIIESFIEELFLSPTLVFLYFECNINWRSYLLGNAGAHALNGNTEPTFYQSMCSRPSRTNNVYMIHYLFPFVNDEIDDKLLDIALSSYDLFSFMDDEGFFGNNYDTNFEMLENTLNIIINDPDLVCLRYKANHWKSHLITNAGMHSTNGNTQPQSYFPAIPVDVNMKVSPEFDITMSTLTDAINKRFDVNVTHDISQDTSETIKTFSETLEKASSNISMSSLETTFSLDNDTILGVSAIIALIGSSINYYVRPNKMNGCIFGASILFAVTRHGPLSFDFSFLKNLGEDSNPRPQISTGELTEVVTTIATLICAYTCANKPGDSLIKNVVSELMNFKKYTSSLDTLLKFAVSSFENCVNFVRRHVLGLSSISFLETGRHDLDSLLKRVRELDDKIHLTQFTYTLENSHMVHSMHQDAIKLLSQLPRDKDSSAMCAALTNAIAYIFRLKTKMDAMNLNLEGIRQEPCSVLLRGAPGIGKSQAMEHLCYRMLPVLVPEDKVEQAMKTPTHFIHNRQAENVFWEGYDHEKVITLFDDLGQARDVQGQPDNEIMNVIRAINVFEYNLHVAGIEKKGNTKFVSKMVIGNTNMPTQEFNSIIEPRAFFRRFDVIVDVCPKPQFCTDETRNLDIWKRKLDYSKLPIGCEGITSMHPDILDFHGYDYNTKSLNGKVYDFDGLVEAMKAMNQVKISRFSQYQKELNVSKAAPQVDWKTFKLSRDRFDFDNSDVDQKVKDYLRKFIVNPDYKHCCQMLCSAYRRQTGFDHKLEFVVAVFLECTPAFEESHSWDFETLAGYLLDETMDISSVPVFGIKYNPTFYSRLDLAYTGFKSSFNSFFKDNYPKLALIPIIIPTIYMCVSTFSTFYNIYTSYSGGSESGHNRTNKDRTTYKKPPTMRHAQQVAGITPQAMLSYDKSNIEVLNKVVARNVYEIILPNNEEVSGFATFIKGNVFMLNRHFVSLCIARQEEDSNFINDEFRLHKPNTDVYVTLPMSVLFNFKVTTVLDDQDVAFVECPKYVSQHSDITKYFVSRNDAHKFKDLVFRLVIPCHNNYRSWLGKAEPMDSIPVFDTTVPYLIRKGYRYMAMTQSGDCGSLFTLCSAHSNAKKIMGIHTAGSPDGYSYATAIFEEDLLEVLEMFDKQVTIDLDTEIFPQSDFTFANKSLAPLYKTTAGVHAPAKSHKIRSELYGKVAPVRTAPCHLRPFRADGILIDPMSNALSKYCKNNVHIESFALSCISSQLFDDLVRTSPNHNDPRIYSFEEAILGLENDTLFSSLSRTSSPGYPDNVDRNVKGKGKSHWLGSETEYDLSNPRALQLKKDVEAIIKDASNLIRNEHIYNDFLKDETRPIEKVNLGKTRLVSSCPMRLLIAYRMYFGAFVRWIAGNKIQNGSAVGVNCYSNDWDMMAKCLDSKGSGRNKGAGDYAAFDASELSSIHIQILDIINDFYHDENNDVRYILFLELTNSRHINGDNVYEWNGSLPSGNPLTTIVNNLYNFFCFRYCWLASHDFDVTCLPNFLDHVYMIVLGDDNIFSVSEEKLPIFNMLSIERHMKTIGMTYTSDDKESQIGQMKTLEEITFLKRHFRYSKELCRYVAPLALFTIVEMLNWTTHGPDSITITEDNVRTATLELALHDKDVFERFTKKILPAVQAEGLKMPKSTSYLQCHLTCSGLDSHF
jgi:hypothetical protein